MATRAPRDLYEFIDPHDAGARAMRLLAPSPPLAPYVRELMITEVDEDTTRLRLPELGLVLGVRYRGAASFLDEARETPIPNASLTGVSKRARRMRTTAGGGIVLVRFHPGGAAPFIDEPLHEIFGTSVALADLLPRADVERIQSRVHEANTDGERAAALEAFLLRRFRARRDDPIVRRALSLLRETHGATAIHELARRLAVSQDALEKRFRRAVGASPKQLASLLRLRRALDVHRPEMTLARLAAEAGFFDQSHLHRELRAFTGETPAAFFRRARTSG